MSHVAILCPDCGSEIINTRGTVQPYSDFDDYCGFRCNKCQRTFTDSEVKDILIKQRGGQSMTNPVSFSIYGTSAEIMSFLKTVDGLSIRHKPVEMAFDTDIDAPKLVELFLTFSSEVGVSLFASWLYDRLRSGSGSIKKKECATLNGNNISGENITIVQIVNIVNSKPDHSNPD